MPILDNPYKRAPRLLQTHQAIKPKESKKSNSHQKNARSEAWSKQRWVSLLQPLCGSGPKTKRPYPSVAFLVGTQVSTTSRAGVDMRLVMRTISARIALRTSVLRKCELWPAEVVKASCLFLQGLHYTPEHCLVNGGFPAFWWRKPCFKRLQHVSFKEPCSIWEARPFWCPFFGFVLKANQKENHEAFVVFALLQGAPPRQYTPAWPACRKEA